MNRVKIYSIVSIDGFASGPDGSMDWLVETNIPRGVEFGIHAFFEGIDTVVMTLGHYLDLASCELLGPHMEKNSIIVRPCEDFDVSSRHKVDYITDPSKGFTKSIERIRELKKGGAGDMWIAGDDKLMRAMISAGMVDDIIITMIPVSLGKGIKLFPAEFNDENWESQKVYHNEYGVTQIHYRSCGEDSKELIN